MKYIVYKTTNLVNSYIYIGVHKTANPDIWDYYLGNGIDTRFPNTYEKAKTKFQQAVKEYGIKNFKREILAVFDSAEEAYELEGIIVNENFLSRSDVYNMILGGKTNIPEGITVYQYNSKGYYINTFDSYESAGKSLHVQPSSIRRAVLYKYCILDTYFTNEKVEKIYPEDFNTNRKKINYRYLKTGEFDQEYESLSSAAKDSNSSSGTIGNAIILGTCVNNKYYFSSIKEKTYDKARSIYIKTRPVYKYDSNGAYLESYETQEEAEKANRYSNITNSIKLKKVDENGFMWSVEKLQNYNIPKRKRNKKVGQFDENGNIVKTWESAKACCKEVGSAVQNVLNGKYSRHKGIIYKYL